MRVLFVRHGETDWNLDGRYQGRADTALCAAGRERARLIGERMRGTNVSWVLSSPLLRAERTAALIKANLGRVRASVDSRLTEIDFGDWQGLTQQEIKRRWPEVLRSWKNNPDTFRFPAGESLLEAYQRILDFVRNPPWITHAFEGDALVVSHAGPIRLASLIADQRSLESFRNLIVRCGEIYEFEWSAGVGLRRLSGGKPAKDRI